MVEKVIANHTTDKIPVDMSLFLDTRFRNAKPVARIWVTQGVYKTGMTQFDTSSTELRTMAAKMLSAADQLDRGWKG